MTSKEIVLQALNHKNIERIPVDFDATNVTGMHCSCVAALREYYGLEKRPAKIRDPFQMLGEIEDDLKQCLGIDTAGVGTRTNMFGYENKDWKQWMTPWGQEVLVPGQFNTTEDEGNIYMYPEGDVSAKPSGRMPKTGYFFDAIVRQNSFDEDHLNAADNTEEFSLFDKADLDYYRREVTKAFQTDRAVVATFGGSALGDVALVPAAFMKNPKGIRDIQEWYISTLIRQDYVHQIFEKQTEIALKNLEMVNREVGDMVDAVFICGTDFGTQISTFCSADTYKELYMPYYKRINQWIHQNTKWKTMKHSCGAVFDFIPLFIESGFDILNPVQCSAAGMEAEKLKAAYGDKIVFWGGGVDTQKILPFGTPQQVRDQVLERCEIFGRNGGFVFNTIHNVQAKTPTENIVAMFDALKEFNC